MCDFMSFNLNVIFYVGYADYHDNSARKNPEKRFLANPTHKINVLKEEKTCKKLFL